MNIHFKIAKSPRYSKTFKVRISIISFSFAQRPSCISYWESIANPIICLRLTQHSPQSNQRVICFDKKNLLLKLGDFKIWEVIRQAFRASELCFMVFAPEKLTTRILLASGQQKQGFCQNWTLGNKISKIVYSQEIFAPKTSFKAATFECCPPFWDPDIFLVLRPSFQALSLQFLQNLTSLS